MIIQGRVVLTMPASAAAMFEAFHNHQTRLKWDSLLSCAEIEGGGCRPYIGAISYNQGRCWKRYLSMRTRLVNYRTSEAASAVLVEPSGPFKWWAETMRHRDLSGGTSELVYTFTLHLRPKLSSIALTQPNIVGVANDRNPGVVQLAYILRHLIPF